MSKAYYKSFIASKTIWLDNIPEHWQETDLRMLFTDNKVKNTGLIEKNLLSLSYGKLKRKDIDNATGLVPASFEGYQIIDEGFIILRFTDLQNDKKSLRVGYANERGIITSAYIGLAPKTKLNSKYYYYLLHFLDKIKYYYNLGGGVRQSLSYKDFGRETVLVPSFTEQTIISEFLDYKLEKIERFLNKKETLIKLLRERINTYIQKSIEEAKEGDNDFWPTIKSSWSIEKSKRIFQEIKLTNFPEEDLLAVTQDRGVIPKRLCEQNFVLPTSGLPNQKLVNKDDFVISLRSFQGGIEFSKYKGIVSPAYTVIRLLPEYKHESFINYYKYLFKTKQFISLLNTAISGIRDGKNINWSDFSELLIPVPEFQDLKRLSNYISTYEKQKIIFKKEKKAILEYREALIAEVVTGKIDVRDFKVSKQETPLAMVAEEAANYKNTN